MELFQPELTFFIKKPTKKQLLSYAKPMYCPFILSSTSGLTIHIPPIVYSDVKHYLC